MDLNILNQRWRCWPHTFAEKASKGKWIAYPHLVYTSKIITEAIFQGDAIIIVQMPPRHGKSEFISHWMPTWFLEMFPEKNVILTSYASNFAAKWGRKVRNELEYNSFCSTKLSPDSTAAHRWNTKEEGGMITAGVDSSVMGQGGHLILIDDPIKGIKQAMSKNYLEHCIEWFKTDIYTRREPGCVIVVLMQRWTEKDLAGAIQADPDFADENIITISLPALADKNDPIGRKEGEPLCIERVSEKRLHKAKRLLGRWFNAMYQQKPIKREGAIFKSEYLTRWNRDELTGITEYTISADLTFGDRTGAKSYDCITVWGKKGPDRFLLDQVRDKLDFDDQVSTIFMLKKRWPGVTGVLVEKKAAGAPVISQLKKKIAGTKPINPTGSKEARAEAVAPIWNSGNVKLPPKDYAEWVNDYEDEILSFPNSEHNDRVDCTTQYLLDSQDATTDDFDLVSLTKTSNWRF